MELALVPLGQNLKEKLIFILCYLHFREVSNDLRQDYNDIVRFSLLIDFQLL